MCVCCVVFDRRGVRSFVAFRSLLLLFVFFIVWMFLLFVFCEDVCVDVYCCVFVVVFDVVFVVVGFVYVEFGDIKVLCVVYGLCCGCVEFVGVD